MLVIASHPCFGEYLKFVCVRNLWHLHPLVVGGEEISKLCPGPVVRGGGFVVEDSPINTVQSSQAGLVVFQKVSAGD